MSKGNKRLILWRQGRASRARNQVARIAPVLTLRGSAREGQSKPADASEDTRTCIVRVNPEEQRSPWLAAGEIPAGGPAVGRPGSKAERLAYA